MERNLINSYNIYVKQGIFYQAVWTDYLYVWSQPYLTCLPLYTAVVWHVDSCHPNAKKKKKRKKAKITKNIPFTFTEENVANWLQHKMVSQCWLRLWPVNTTLSDQMNRGKNPSVPLISRRRKRRKTTHTNLIRPYPCGFPMYFSVILIMW